MLGGTAELEEEPATPRADFQIAMAGPIASALLGLAGLGTAVFVADVVHPLPAGGLAWLGVGNLLLALVNLLPGAPLDGGRILRAAVWSSARPWASRDSRNCFCSVGSPVCGSSCSAGFLLFAAQAEFAAGPLRERLGGVRVGEIMDPSPTIAPGWWTVDAFAEHAAGAGHDRVFPVLSFDGVPVGIVGFGDLIRVPADARRATRIEDVARKDQTVTVVGADAEVTELTKRVFLRHGRDLVLVTEAGALAGVVGAGDLARALELATLGHRPRASAPHSPRDPR